MKNLFKSLMLVAVAAMAFTACSQDNNEVNKVEKVTRYEFVADFADDTRSGFAEKEEGATAYKSEWFGDETIKVFVTDYNSYNVQLTTEISTEGKFELELTDAPESFFVTVVSPAESWVSEYTANIPVEQTPLANSVDPKAHLLQAQAVPVSNGSAAISMTHMAAYGKMTVNGVDFEIDHVVIDLKGSYYGYDRELSYTINADNVENNTFWFATEPIDVAEFTVTAYDAEDNAVAKTVDVAAAGKTLSFTYGRVSTFSVSDLKEVEAPTAPAFTSASWTNTWAPSDKLVQFSSEELGTLQLNFYNANEDDSAAWLDARTYGFAMNYDIYPGGTYSFYVDTNGHSHYVTAGSVTVSVVDGEYYYIEFNNLTNSDGTFTLTATFKGSIENLSVPDTREKLAMPKATATADGNVINISWESVTGADEYYVFCYVGGLEAVTTKDTSVTIEAAYNTSYQFLIRAVAYDSNPDYKNSDDSYFSVTTEKDPNVFAQYIASNLYWDNSGYFVFVVDQYEIFRVKMNDADCPDHTTILEGEYTGIGSSTVPAKSFSVYQKVVGGFSEGWTSTKQTSTMSVSYVNGEYVIIVNYVGAYGGSGEVGYKGIPEGWVVPGSSSGDDNTDDSDDDNTSDSNMPGSESNPYEFTSVSKGQWDIQFTGADNGDRIVMDCNTTNVDSWIGDHGADTWIPMNTLLYGSGASIYGYNGTDYINSAFWGSSFVKVVKSGSTYTFTFNMSIDGGTTKTYYTYTGTL